MQIKTSGQKLVEKRHSPMLTSLALEYLPLAIPFIASFKLNFTTLKAALLRMPQSSVTYEQPENHLTNRLEEK